MAATHPKRNCSGWGLDVFKRYEHTHPPLAALKVAFESMLQQTRPTYIIIDAIDECPSHTGEWAKLLDLLQCLGEPRASSLQVLVTSRKERDIEDKLAGLTTDAPIGIQEKDTDVDIRTHVKAQLMHDSTMSRWPEAGRLEVENALPTKANGVYA
jgi:ankyrin repeat domain-containing protein 50